METIHVPAPPKEAFNKHRRMSDLIKAQVSHLKHVEERFPQAIREALPVHQIVTENDAAQYIAAMTSILRSGATVPAKRVSAMKRPASTRSREPISLAAAGDVANTSAPKGNVSTRKASRTPRNRGSSAKGKK
jgi:hypothetical protein